jgi:hypothetical protein
MNNWFFPIKQLHRHLSLFTGLDMALKTTVAAVVMPAAMLHAGNEVKPGESAVTFGPVIARTVFDNNGPVTKDSMIDLETGKFLRDDEPEIVGLAGLEQMIRRIRTSGIDLIGDASGKTFSTLDMAMVPIDDPFDSLSAKSVFEDQRLEARLEERTIKPKEPLPATFLFRTRAETRGVLQIVRFSDDLTSMDIQYKLVYASKPQPAARREPTEKTVPDATRRLEKSQRLDPARFSQIAWAILPGDNEKRFLNLDTGKLELTKSDKSLVAYVDKVRSSGWHLIIEGLHNYHAEHADIWTTMSAETVAEPAGLAGLPFERTGYYELHPEVLPAVVLIPQWGLLEISGIEDHNGNRPSVILRLKRVNSAVKPLDGKSTEKD